MNIVLRQAKIIDPTSPFHQQHVDIFIKDGIVATIADKINDAADEEIKIPGLHVSAGWLDIFSNFCDPGYEYKETLETGAAAAAKGGYTDVMVLPNTAPPLHTKSSIEYIVQKSKGLPVTVHPIAAVTKNAEGKELAEMYDMFESGAIAFSDGIHSIQSSGMLLKALQYVKAINKIIIQVPDDKWISTSGLMNEGIISTQLGLPGKPAIAEELMIMRDLELVKYTDSKIHFTGISTKKSIELITAAKESGVNVTCSVTPYHLFFSDEDLQEYDTNLKVNPPLRTKNDVRALQKALTDGTIDCIATHHLPQDADNKVVEFENAKDGMIGLETCFAAIRTIIPSLSAERIVEVLCINPRKIFDLPYHSIKKDENACLTFFTLDEEWTIEKNSFASRSNNSAFAGKTLKGKPLGIINKERLILNT